MTKIQTERAAYIESLREVSTGLIALGIKADTLEEGHAEVGFELPRDLFHNELDGLIEELKVVRRVIRAVAEAATGSVDPIEFKTISTSSPEFVFDLAPQTFAMLGGAVTWALNSWKQIEEIRRIRADIRKAGLDKFPQLAEILDAEIAAKVSEAVSEKVTKIIGTDGMAGRKEEQRTDLTWALNALLQRVERGMVVRVDAFLPTK